MIKRKKNKRGIYTAQESAEFGCTLVEYWDALKSKDPYRVKKAKENFDKIPRDYRDAIHQKRKRNLKKFMQEFEKPSN